MVCNRPADPGTTLRGEGGVPGSAVQGGCRSARVNAHEPLCARAILRHPYSPHKRLTYSCLSTIYGERSCSELIAVLIATVFVHISPFRAKISP